LSSPTPHRLRDPIWGIGDALGWLPDRNPASFGRFWTTDDFLSEQRYKSTKPSLCRRPQRVLLHALQRGQLAAYEQTKRLDRTFWIDKFDTFIPKGIGRFVVESDEVLRLWPALPSSDLPDEVRCEPRSPTRRTRGPTPGTIDRFGKQDRALFPALERLMENGSSLTAACNKLARDEQIAGNNSALDSRARRLRNVYRKDNPLPALTRSHNTRPTS
jgi:hypothetical protein